MSDWDETDLSALENADNVWAKKAKANEVKANGPGADAAKPQVRAWRDSIITAEELRNKTFPPAKLIIPGILPEGLALLSGKPKVGKSFMAMDFAVGVTTGEKVFGSLEPSTGDCLYAANEDTQRRLKGRMAKFISPFTEWPSRLALATEWRRLDQGGVDDLKSWASEVQQPRLAIIDTLATVRPTSFKNENPYDRDYRALAELHDWVGSVLGLTVLVLQHNRKADSDDAIDLISGTLGGPGVADTLLVLAVKPGKGIIFYVKGRDVEEQELVARFDKQTCRWHLLGTTAEALPSETSETRKKIIEALLKSYRDRMNPTEIAAASGLAKNTVDQRLLQMVADGQVIKLGRGSYAHPERV